MTNYTEMLNAAKPKIVITPSSLIMEKVGDTFRGMYLGQKEFTRIDKNTGEVKINTISNFYDGEKVRFNMGVQLNRAIAVLKSGVSVEIKLVELKANKNNGKTKIYSIAPLDMPIQDISELFGGFLELTAPKDEDLMFSDAPQHAQIEAPTTGDVLVDLGFEPDEKSVKQPALIREKTQADFMPD
jgi:hypothetical protein